ncbi:Toluene efflux pump outer membrane protein TtgI precursor [Anaerohalosphaera lusitana]|uniref:Toluene efflux pump outer membrane protein TtgI n=1 Tax=Anaerohalosphaera lusitana TaxID=1936003 RepID=A0A1U9NQ11_9BACT|nr:efflux transporter outer membrane subunit [Anaerohalosphaera lusitana]AQT70021.1 Toluene efflux pump outer membrane protein TtgI precursor [Anaerohalosphaera lusitana]
MNKLSLLATIILVLVAGCSPVGPDYEKPALTDPDFGDVLAARTPAAEKANPVTAEDIAAWWDSFDDQTLNDLITEALIQSPSMKQAYARIVEARARLGIAEAGLAPRIDLGGSYTRSQASENIAGPGQASRARDIYQTGFDAAWELDVFGGVRRAVQASQASLQSEHENLKAIWVSLAGDVSSTYIELRTLQQRLRVARENLAIQEETLELVESLYESGLSDELAVQQARYNLETTSSTIPTLQSNIEEVANALCVLTGQMPGRLNQKLKEADQIPSPAIKNVTAIPANTLRNRPDVKRAERDLAAQTARIGVATSELYPRFTLGGSIGLESLKSSTLFQSDSSAYGFGPSFSMPIFEAGAIRNNIKAQTAIQEQVMASYENTVLSAAKEVRDALIALANEQRRYDRLASAVESASQAVQIAEDQYKNGLSDFNNVLLAQQSLLSLQENLVISQGTKSNNLVRLYKALGGGLQPLDGYEEGLFSEQKAPAKDDGNS